LIPFLTPVNTLLWILIVGLIGFFAMGADKLMATSNWSDRISEKTLWLTALSGGFIGIFAGGQIFHHKTSKTEFWVPVVFATMLWVLLLCFLLLGVI
jgi:uncharacterized membrane protein YsdA (DUF1294 family)